MNGHVSSLEAKRPVFPGFPEFRANVTFVPIQYFTVVLPHCSRGCVRIVGYMIRKILGWVDEQGNPTRATLRFSYRQLIEQAGVSRKAITDALDEAIHKKFIRCVTPPQPDRAGQAGQCAKTQRAEIASSGPEHTLELRQNNQTAFGSPATSPPSAPQTGPDDPRSEKVNGKLVRKEPPNTTEEVNERPVRKGARYKY